MTTVTANLAQQINAKHRMDRQHQGISGLIAGHVVAAHLNACITAGWTRREIASTSGVSVRAIRYIINGQPTVQHHNATRLLAIRPEDSPRVPAGGVIRRVKALARAGYPIDWTGQQIGCSHRHIYEILNGTVTLVDRRFAERLADLYRRNEATPGPSNPARIAAKARDWAGPDGWDADSIDDPNAHPDWTGHCGTDHGWWLHKINGIPVCARCNEAHAVWLAERKDLPSRERLRQLALAKGDASNRGACLAHDGRELMRHGLDYEQAAERLGITRQHLQQELLRHPAADETAAKAGLERAA